MTEVDANADRAPTHQECWPGMGLVPAAVAIPASSSLTTSALVRSGFSRRAHTRYPIGLREAVRAALRLERGWASCELIDFSRSGCAIEVRAAAGMVPRDVNLRLTDTAVGATLEIVTRARSVQQVSIGLLRVGLNFRRPLGDEVIERMLHDGILTRRTSDRVVVDVPIDLRRMAGDTEVIHGRILDYSAGGLRLATGRPLAINERILVRLALPDGAAARRVPRVVALAGRVVWTGPAIGDRPCHGGLAFGDLAGSRELCDALHEMVRQHGQTR